MLEIKDLTIQYGEKDAVVENFSLTIKKGEIISIVGESGSGKSTVLRSIIGGLLGQGKIISGDIIFNGKSLLNLSTKEWREIRGVAISMISQDCGGTLNPIRKIGSQYIEYINAHANLNKFEAENKALFMLEKVRLPEPKNIMNSYPYELSGGMKQRVGIAIALTFEPELVLADEPTSALDVTTQAQIVKQMMELREEFNTAIIIVTHNMGVAAYMADKIIVMQNGVVVDSGTRKEVINNPKSDYTKKLLKAIPEMEGERFV